MKTITCYKIFVKNFESFFLENISLSIFQNKIICKFFYLHNYSSKHYMYTVFHQYLKYKTIFSNKNDKEKFYPQHIRKS